MVLTCDQFILVTTYLRHVEGHIVACSNITLTNCHAYTQGEVAYTTSLTSKNRCQYNVSIRKSVK